MFVISLQFGIHPTAGYATVAFMGLLLFVFIACWVWVLIDCVRHEPEGNEKLIWTVVILVFGFLGAFFTAWAAARSASNCTEDKAGVSTPPTPWTARALRSTRAESVSSRLW